MHGHHHHHGHDHDHSHGHSHGGVPHGQAFAIGIALNLGFVLVETVFGLLNNSLALLADATHNFSDVIGLLLAWGGAWLAARRPTLRRTFGYRRASILAALGNAGLLFMAIGVIVVESIRRIYDPQPLAGHMIMLVAGIGVVVNFATACLFLRGRKTDINIRGAYLHMAADAAVSMGVVVAGLLISATNWVWLDPVISLLIVLVIGWSSWGLARDSVNLAMDAVPAHIDRNAVEAYLKSLPGVSSVHDLHIWAMSTTEVALTAHIVRPDGKLDDAFLCEVSATLASRHGISHPTLQIEAGNGPTPCALEPEHVV